MAHNFRMHASLGLFWDPSFSEPSQREPLMDSSKSMVVVSLQIDIPQVSMKTQTNYRTGWHITNRCWSASLWVLRIRFLTPWFFVTHFKFPRLTTSSMKVSPFERTGRKATKFFEVWGRISSFSKSSPQNVSKKCWLMTTGVSAE